MYGLGVEPTVIRVAPFVWSNGGELVDDPNGRRGSRSTPRGAGGAPGVPRRCGSLGVIPTDAEVEAEDDESRFANGRLAMLLSLAPLDADVPDDHGLRLGRRAAPALGEAGRDPPLRRVLPDQRPRSARTPRGRSSSSRSAGGPAHRRPHGPDRALAESVSRSEAFLDPAAKPPHSRVFLDAIPTIRRVPTISTWPEIEDAAEGILENGLYLGQRRGRSHVRSTA